MVRYTGPKNRIARRFGVNVFGRARNPLLHKQHPPGMHGARRRKKSDYGLQLEEKQKLKAIYGMLTEKQLVNYYKKAVAHKGGNAEHMVQMIESRLDVVVYRLKLASTIFAAQQLVAHGHVQVDGRKVDIRSFQVKPGMVISLREKSKGIQPVEQGQQNAAREVPGYLELDDQKRTGRLVNLPTLEELIWPLEINVAEVWDLLAHTT